MDHWFQMENLAPATDRRPGLLAKIVATLDVLSGGRAQLGIGAAWYEREHRGLGVPYPPVAERFELLEETIQICRQMWSDDDGPFHGRHFELAETICSPRPITQPRPRIVIGGSGEKKTLRLVARYADACNLFAPSVEVVRDKLEVLKGHCEAEGRDPATIARTILAFGNPYDDLDEFLHAMEGFAALGVDQVALMPTGDPVAFIEMAGDTLIPRLAKMGDTAA